MMHSRTLVLITLFVIFLTVFVSLRMMDPKTVVEIPNNLEAEETAPETVIVSPVVPVLEEVPPSEVDPVVPNPAPVLPPPVKIDGCYIGGCSGQVCSEHSDLVTTCEWREEYACYKTTVCERQSTGDCGWTETAELKSCLRDATVNQDSDLRVQ